MSTIWKPSTDFEEEIVNLQPQNDFIFGGLSILNEDNLHNQCPRPPKHLEYVKNQFQQEQQRKEEHNVDKTRNKLQLLSDIQRMAGIKSIGEQTTLADWYNREHIEQETLGMMRYFGMEASIDEPLREDVTLATYPISNTNPLRRNGHRIIPLIFDDDFFNLKPLIPSTGSDDSDNDIQVDDAQVNCKETQKNSSLITSPDATINTSSDDCYDSTTSSEVYKTSSLSSSISFKSETTSSYTIYDQMLKENEWNTSTNDLGNDCIHKSNECIDEMQDKNVDASAGAAVSSAVSSRTKILLDYGNNNNRNKGAIKKTIPTKPWPDLNSSMNKTYNRKKTYQANNIKFNTYANVVQQKEENEVPKIDAGNGKIVDDHKRVVISGSPASSSSSSSSPTVQPPKKPPTVTLNGKRNSLDKKKTDQKLMTFYNIKELYKMKRTKPN